MKIYNYEPKERKPKSRSFFSLSGKKMKWGKFNFKKFLIWTFRALACGVLLFAILFLYYSKDLPDPNKLLAREVPESTKIFARDGSLLYEIHGEVKRTQVGLDQISDNLKHATVAIEDKNFYHHGGIVPTSLVRSVLVDIVSGEKKQGGSTITQQLVKNAILSRDKSFDRKIKEIILAIAIDSRFSKDDILKLYLNEVPYGRNAYGVEAASQTYFGKSAKDISLAESAYLAAIVQAPTFYSPLGPNRQALDDRKNYVLSLMKDQGYISEEDQLKAKDEKVIFASLSNGISAPHFSLMVQNYLADKYGETTLEEGGLKVYTTLDPKLQAIAEDVVKKGVEAVSKKYNANNAALVAIDPKTGQILAMVGSKDYFGKPEPAGCIPGTTAANSCTFEPNYNVALSTTRQPGSSFKPYVYLTAFKPEFKYSPATMLTDVVTDFGKFGNSNYIPKDYDNKQRGPVSIRSSLAGSLNIPAVKTLSLVGVDNATQTAHDLGITSPLSNCGLSLVLGGCTVRLLDHVAAYSVIANEGLKNDATAILKIVDKQGKTLEEYQSNPKQVVDAQAAYELISIMTDNNARTYVFGPNSPLILPDRVVAAKTGTTQNWHDGWTMGFTPSLAAGVWAGNNNGALLKAGADGVFVAAPIWNAFMKQALASTTPETFAVPPGIKQVTVDSLSGKLPTDLTPSTKVETFADYSVPDQSDDTHVSVAIDTLTGQPANSLTPPGQISYQTYKVLHSERRDDPNWENPVIAWALAQPANEGWSYPPNTGVYIPPSNSGNGPSVSIVSPADGATISKLPVTLTVSAASNNGISRIDVSVDGKFINSITGSPYYMELGSSYGDGQHTIAVRAVDSGGAVSDTSITVTYALNGSLNMTSPSNGDMVTFPLTLTSQSSNNYNQVGFYYTDNAGITKPIGPASSTYVGDGYQYTTTWQNPVPKGTYKVYSQSDTGVSSAKIKLVVQ
jgi:1A family penicillin-binding protein